MTRSDDKEQRPAAAGGGGGGDDPATLLAAHLDFIHGVVRHVAARNHLSPQDAEDFEQDVRLKLIEKDYAVLRSFRKHAKLSTFLVVVIQKAFLDFRIKRWGKWRSSSTALRLGPVASALERMVYSDGNSLDESHARLLQSGAKVSRQTLEEYLARIPPRPKRREVGEEEIGDAVSAHPPPDAGIEEVRRQAVAVALEAAFEEAILGLPREDRYLVEMVFIRRQPVRALAPQFNQKPRHLYRTIEQCKARIRAHIEGAGFDAAQILDLIGHPAVRLELAKFRRAVRKNGLARPSHPPGEEEETT